MNSNLTTPLLILLLLLTLIRAEEASLLSLDSSDITKIAALAGNDMLHSDFAKKDNKVIAISDFLNKSDFELDISLLARLLIKEMRKDKSLSLTAAISGNALNADPMLDKIRQLRNNSEFSDIIPKNSLIAPTYSLSARISSQAKEMGDMSVVEYSFIFNITDLHTGLVVWDYIDSVKKIAKMRLPKDFVLESKFGKACMLGSLEDKELRRVCEFAISEIWEDNIQNILPKKQKLFANYAQKACELDSAFGCRALGSKYRFGIGGERDFKEAIKYYKKSCELKDGASCYNLASMYQNAQGVNQNISLAKSYATASCSLRFNSGCEYERSLQEVNEIDNLEEREKEYAMQCEANNGYACGLLSTSYRFGFNGASKNEGKYVMLLKKGCDLGDINSCYQLSLLQMQGISGESRDMKAAINNMIKSCDTLSIEQSCPPENEKYKCRENIKMIKGSACLSLGSVYEYGAIVGMEADTPKALHYYKKSCELKLDNGCKALNTLREKVR